jgi:hypothetical protein
LPVCLFVALYVFVAWDPSCSDLDVAMFLFGAGDFFVEDVQEVMAWCGVD